jgi:hypothetical protein
VDIERREAKRRFGGEAAYRPDELHRFETSEG